VDRRCAPPPRVARDRGEGWDKRPGVAPVDSQGRAAAVALDGVPRGLLRPPCPLRPFPGCVGSRGAPPAGPSYPRRHQLLGVRPFRRRGDIHHAGDIRRPLDIQIGPILGRPPLPLVRSTLDSRPSSHHGRPRWRRRLTDLTLSSLSLSSLSCTPVRNHSLETPAAPTLALRKARGR